MTQVVLPDPFVYARRHQVVITPWSDEAIGKFLMGLQSSGSVTTSSVAYPAANVGLFVPFSTWEPLTFKEVFWYTGAVTGGNVDIGIYDATCVNRLASLGGVSRGTASAPNTSTTFTDYVLPPGDLYYMSISHDNVNTFAAITPAAGLLAAAGVLEATSAYALPSTVTPALTTRAYLPAFGLLLEPTAL